MANTAGIADIRKATMGAARSLKQFESAVKAIRQRCIRAAQLEGRKAFKRMYEAYQVERYFNAKGQPAHIKPYSERHRKRKLALRLSLQRGVMRKGIIKHVRSPKSFMRTAKGFTIDLEAPNLTVTGRSSVNKLTGKKGGPVFLAGKRVITGKGKDRQVSAIMLKQVPTSNKRSFAVNNYLKYFAEQKAPGLGTLSNGDRAAIEDAIRTAALQFTQQVGEQAKRRLRSLSAAKITIRLNDAANPVKYRIG